MITGHGIYMSTKSRSDPFRRMKHRLHYFFHSFGTIIVEQPSSLKFYSLCKLIITNKFIILQENISNKIYKGNTYFQYQYITIGPTSVLSRTGRREETGRFWISDVKQTILYRSSPNSQTVPR